MSKDDLIKDLIEVTKKYYKEGIKQPLSRNYYRQHSKYKNEYEKHFGTFAEFKKSLPKNELEEIKKIETEKTIIQLEEERNQYKKDRESLLKERIVDENLLSLYEQNLKKRKQISINNKVIKNTSTKHGILNLSDWHVGEVVEPEEVGFVNSYNIETFFKRADNIFNKFVGYCETIGIKSITLNFLGDLLTGNIHQELERTADVNVVDSLFLVNDYIIEKLEWLSSFFNNIKLNFIVGNHGRIVAGDTRPFFKGKATLNWENILSRQIKMVIDKTKTKKIIINIPKSWYYLDKVNETVFLLHHGDVISGTGGFAGIPYYGMAMSAAKLYGSLGLREDINFNHIIMGHFHTRASVPLFQGGTLFLNSSLIGATEYSLAKVKAPNDVSQLMLVIDKNGNIDGEISIKGN